MKDIKEIIKEHSFFKDLKPEYLDFIAGCASNVVFKEDEMILREGDEANKFCLIRHGRVAIDIPLSKQRGITIQTIKDGDILGWSWLIPPHNYRFNAKAITETRAISFDGKCLREKCETKHELGYELLKRLAAVFISRLEMTRLQLVNSYDRK